MTATKRCNTIQHVISIAVHTAAVEGFEDNVVLHAHTLRELRRACGYARKPQTDTRRITPPDQYEMSINMILVDCLLGEGLPQRERT